MSKTSIDRLGDRLRDGPPSEADLESLSAYREAFRAAYLAVASVLRDELGHEFTGRPAKSTAAIVDKLRREKIRLTQIQDVAGARVLVPNVLHQDELVRQLLQRFPGGTALDRRAKPSHGYRAVHVIARLDSVSVEVQIRTQLQHKWAEVSEKLSDTVDPSIKYGGGPQQIRSVLDQTSTAAAEIEEFQGKIAVLRAPHRLAAADLAVQLEFDQMSAEIENRVQGLQRALDAFADVAPFYHVVGKEFT